MHVRLNGAKFWALNATTLFILVFYSISKSFVNGKENDSHNLKYILQWTESAVFKDEGQKAFQDRKCKFQNCYVTFNRSVLSDIKSYEFVAFYGPELLYLSDFPKERSPSQRYIFVSDVAADSYELCQEWLNGFFNWSWTYKLNSEIPFGYITVKDKKGNIIGPKESMDWLDLLQMEDVTPETQEKLRDKSKFAAMIASDCLEKDISDQAVTILQKELDRFDVKIDVYGNCGSLKCPPDGKIEDCLKIIERDYFFYLDFESRWSGDYVTDTLLRSLQNYAIPVVSGSVNFTRFMPDGIYINAIQVGPELFMETLVNVSTDHEKYLKFFKWHNHYSYHNRSESPESDNYCNFCKMLNDDELLSRNTVYHNFLHWWNGDTNICGVETIEQTTPDIERSREDKAISLIETESEKIPLDDHDQMAMLPFLDV